MNSTHPSFAVPLIILMMYTVGQDAAEAQTPTLRGLMRQYCFDCHNADEASGEANLEWATTPEGLARSPKLLDGAIRQLTTAKMPPDDPRPTPAERSHMVAALRTALSKVDWQALSRAGDVPLPRVTRDEYQFMLSDLLGVTVPLDDLLPSDAEGPSGYQTDRSMLAMSETDFERFMRAAERASSLAIATVGPQHMSEHVEIEDFHLEQYSPKYRDPIEFEGATVYQFSGARGVKVQRLTYTFEFPETGYYRLRFHGAAKTENSRVGLSFALDGEDKEYAAGIVINSPKLRVYETELFATAGPHEMVIRYDHGRVPWMPEPPKRPRYLVPFEVTSDRFEDEEVPPESYARLSIDELSSLGLGGAEPEQIDKQLDEVHELSIELYQKYYQRAVYYRHNVIPLYIGTTPGKLEDVQASLQSLAELISADQQDVYDLWERRLSPTFRQDQQDSDLLTKLRADWKRTIARNLGFGLMDWIEIQGPIVRDADSGPRQDFADALQSADPTAVRNWVQSFVSHVVPSESRTQQTSRLMQFYEERRQEQNHRVAFHELVTAMCVSPFTLYRSEAVSGSESQIRLSNDVVNARMARLLWLSVSNADDVDIDLATELALVRQADAMIDDPRFGRFCRAFTAQWLDLNVIGRDVVPNADLFLGFSQHLANDMREEIARMFQRVIVEDRPLTELLDADWTIINERLARHYGLATNAEADWQIVQLANTNRGGLLGTAGLLTATSSSVRTSPVKRGVHVLTNLLGETFPPPPPNVGELSDEAGNSSAVSLREELAQHRQNVQCASCHDRIDPTGFALENFDLVGRWRTSDAFGAIDAHATMPDGSKLDGAAELKEYLAEEQGEAFVRNLIEQILAFATGRTTQYYDQAEVNRIYDDLQQNEFRARALIHGVVTSRPFLYRETDPAALSVAN